MEFTERSLELRVMAQNMNKFVLNKCKVFYLLCSVVFSARNGEYKSIEGYFAFAVYYTSNYMERVETSTASKWNSSSAEPIFDLKIPTHSFQTTHQKRGRLDESSRIIWSKIYPIGQEQPLKRKRVSKIFKTSECVAPICGAEGKRYSPA